MGLEEAFVFFFVCFVLFLSTMEEAFEVGVLESPQEILKFETF